MPRAEFEQLVADLYCSLGHDARRTGGPGDRDFDVVIVTKTGQHWIAQCKQWRGAVGESVVREFYAAMAREHATQGAIITTARFTPKAAQWAQGKPIHLYDGSAFLQAVQRSLVCTLDADEHGGCNFKAYAVLASVTSL
jgi:restriction system protein